MGKHINRGDIYYADLEDNIEGSEQAGIRPVVIVQNDVGNEYSPTTIIVPITSKIQLKARIPTHVFIKKNKKRLITNSIALVEQLKTIDKKRLRYFLGTLDENEIKAIDKAIIVALGLDKTKVIDEENEIIKLTKKQIASYCIVAKEYLKHTGNEEISNKLFGEYVLDIMKLYSPEEIEKKAKEYI